MNQQIVENLYQPTLTIIKEDVAMNEQISVQLKEIIPEFYQIPSYLSEGDELFEEFIQCAIAILGKPMDDQNSFIVLQKLMIYIYRHMLIEIYQLVWSNYYKSGTGELLNDSKEIHNYPTNVSVWPKLIKNSIRQLYADEKNQNQIYLQLVETKLKILNKHAIQYKFKIEIVANEFENYTLPFQKMIERYIENHFQSIQLSAQHLIDLVIYDYHIQAIKRAFNACQPNSIQKKLMKQMCSWSYAIELNEQAYRCHLDKIQLNYLENEETTSNSIDHIELEVAREEALAAVEMFENIVDEFNTCFQTDGINNLSSQTMMNLIQFRCMKIRERIQCIYNYKNKTFISL